MHRGDTHTYVLVADDQFRHIAAIPGINGAVGTSTLCGQEVQQLAYTPPYFARPSDARENCEPCQIGMVHTAVIRGEGT